MSRMKTTSTEEYIDQLIYMCENRYCKTEDDKLVRDNEIEHYKTIKQKLKEEKENDSRED
jgi:hypothetical protein